MINPIPITLGKIIPSYKLNTVGHRSNYDLLLEGTNYYKIRLDCTRSKVT